ncbi:unnamed protein product [Vitrella brassicaformis CCMP3155]|uniref:Saccharopine dehydrogenase NADP binding domain-containing protein n=1 Tax=Vitrella brassicaformis (strain CCMP3155) TaxID=1169540 RepID=A0A0G4EEI3_VITBC|nr:unnamed protein product [Vitrella brassicaformis CCMP3155]|eukprot:CEL94399.1 unnamed protein product [Vitrella brassicaformis CCMP3155]
MPPSLSSDERESRPFDVIVWGATGFTGKLLSAYYAKTYGPSGHSVKYALGGRSKTKLDKVVEDIAEKLGDKMIKNTPLVIGDASDKASMIEVAKQTRAVASVVGPFAQHGEPLVAACAEAGTHYVDITGEFTFMRKMIVKYSSVAEQNGAKIVHACGFDSVPSDMGAFMVQSFAKEKFGRPCESVLLYMMDAAGGFSGGTLHSLMGMYEAPKEEQQRYASKDYLVAPKTEDALDLPPSKEWLLAGTKFQWDDDMQVYTAPFVMAGVNVKVVRRTASLLKELYGEEFSYDECAGIKNRLAANVALGAFTAMEYLNSFTIVRSIAKRLVPQGSGPSEKVMTSGYFDARVVGKTKDENGVIRKVVATVGSKLGDPGYMETAKMVGESALCAALDGSTTPSTYGVLTPATAFGDALIKRLRNAGMTFDVEELGAAEAPPTSA